MYQVLSWCRFGVEVTFPNWWAVALALTAAVIVGLGAWTLAESHTVADTRMGIGVVLSRSPIAGVLAV
jgi:hypothetical protein